MRPLSATFAFVCRSRFSKPFQAIAGENQVEAAEYDSLRYMETLIVETDGHFQNTIPINSIFTGSKLTKICLLLMSFMNSSNSRRSRTNNAVPNGGGPRVLSTLVSSASPGDCGSMGVGVFGSGFAAALFGAGTLQGFED